MSLKSSHAWSTNESARRQGPRLAAHPAPAGKAPRPRARNQITPTSTTLPMRSRAQPRRCNLSPSALCLRHATGLSRSIPQQHWPQSCVPSPACQPPPKASATRCAGHGPATWPLLALCVMGTKRPSHQARLHRPNETLHPRLVRCQRLHVAAQLVHLPAVPASASHVAAPLLP